jgi:polysaccharide biosynthesis transport protein
MQEFEMTKVLKTLRPVAALPSGPTISVEQTGVSSQAEPSLAVEYFRMLIRRRWLILPTAVLGALIGLLVTLPTEPLYRAHTTLDVQGVNESFMNMHAVDQRATPGEQTAESFLQTQIKLLESESMIARVLNKVSQEAAAEPEMPQDLISLWRQRLGWGVPEQESMEAMVRDVAKSVKVKPMGRTRLVEITCESTSASLSAAFCNTLASEFIKNDLEVRSETAQKTGEYLSQQLQDVRKNLESKERLLQSYAQETTLLASGDKEGIAQEKLRQLQTELSQAQADRIVKQSTYELVASATPDSLPPVLDSGTLHDYQVKLSDLKQQYADISTSFTSDYPKVQRIEAQIHELEATIAKERQDIVARIKNDYAAAKHREVMLAAAYGGQARMVSSLAPKQTQYNMLQHEVESGRQLYETLLQRVKEAGFVSALRSSPVRIVDTAKEPQMPVSPQRALAAAAGLFVGCLVGVFIAFFRDRTDRRLQMPGEATLQLRVRELGVIPAASVERQPLANVKRLPVPVRSEAGLKLLGPAGGAPPSGLELVTWFNKGSLMAESYRGVMSSLLFSGANPGEKMKLLVTSPSVSEGKTTLLSNLGIALAQTKRSVVLIDGDLRRPRLHKVFHVDNSTGLSNVLLGDIDPITCPLDRIVRATTVPGLYVVPAGSPVDDPASTLFSPHLAPLMERLNREFSAILMDSPPMLHLTDARVLARYADGVVLVVRAGATTLDAAANAQQIFDADSTPIVGTVLNDFDPSHDLNLNYYKSYHQYQEQKSA